MRLPNMPKVPCTPSENEALGEAERQRWASRMTALPARLTIESTTLCNLRCVMCHHSFNGVDRPRHMPDEIIGKVAEVMKTASTLSLFSIGEPLAAPVFWRVLERKLYHPEAQLTFNTNLQLLNDRKLDRLLACEAKMTINVSTDAAAERTYRRIRGADFNVLIDNIQKIVSRRNGDNPHVIMNMTLMRENIEEVIPFIEMAKDLGVSEVHLWHLNRWDKDFLENFRQTREDGWEFDYEAQGLWNHPALSNTTLRAATKRAEELGITLVMGGGKAMFFAEDEEEQIPESTETVKDCLNPWKRMVVYADGSVRPCCFATRTVGNLNHQSFDEIWNGQDMRRLRLYCEEDAISPVCANSVCKYVQNTLARRKRPGKG